MKSLASLIAGCLSLGLSIPVFAQSHASSDCAAIATPDQKIDEDTIRRIEQGWLTAEYRGNPKFLDCLLEADYRTNGKSGQIRTRQEVIDHVPLTTDSSRAVPTLETIVILHGNNATAHSIMHTTDKSGNPKEVHFVDAYTFHDNRWYAYSGTDF